MRIPGIKTGKSFFRWLRARVYGGALVLGYHRISASQGALDDGCVSPENFAEHLHALRKYMYPIRLSKLVQHLKDGSLPDKSIALTFDDGYADNLYVAKPLLEKYEIPATVFMCTGYMGREFWWDELERLVTGSRTDPHLLHLRAEGKQFEWHQATVSAAEGRAVTSEELCRALYQFLLSLDVEDQKEAMNAIRRWANVSQPGTSTRRAMSQEELLRLVDGGLIELGAHTRHHPMLPQLSFEAQKEEIQAGKTDLESLVNEKIMGFSYPNGRATVDAKRLVQEMGFNYACTSLHDVVRPGNDVFELTRFWQRDVDGDEFWKDLGLWLK